MKTLLLIACLCAAGGGDREEGLQLYQDGKFAEAAAAFRRAIEHDGAAPDLQWNLALASWRAGDLAAAETAAEKYAALAQDARVDLHRGLLGAVRFAEAQAREGEAEATGPGAGPPMPAAAGQADAVPPDPLPLLEQALAKAKQAKDHFVAGAAAKATPESLRNTERALRYIDELQQKIDALKQQREEQPKQDDKNDEKKDDDKKQDENQNDKQDQPKDDQKQQQDQQDQQDQKDQPGDQSEPQPGDGQEPPEPQQKPSPEDGKSKGQPEQEDEPQQQAEPKPEPADPKDTEQAQPRTDAPGETVEGKELTPEQTKRLLEQLKQLDGKLQALRQGQKTGRRPVGRDW